jgi:hypothetical protein
MPDKKVITKTCVIMGNKMNHKGTEDTKGAFSITLRLRNKEKRIGGLSRSSKYNQNRVKSPPKFNAIVLLPSPKYLCLSHLRLSAFICG